MVRFAETVTVEVSGKIKFSANAWIEKRAKLPSHGVCSLVPPLGAGIYRHAIFHDAMTRTAEQVAHKDARHIPAVRSYTPRDPLHILKALRLELPRDIHCLNCR
jgi:hypothetical protein